MHISLNSLAKVVRSNFTALDFLLLLTVVSMPLLILLAAHRSLKQARQNSLHFTLRKIYLDL